MKVLIFSVSTGQGHNVAARAVAEHLTATGAECVLDDAVFRVGSWLGKATNALYSLAINSCRFFYGKFYAVAEHRRANSYTGSFARSVNRTLVRNIRLKIEAENPDVILCTHPFAASALDAVKQKHPFRAKLAGIVTDFTVHPFWEDALRLDLLFVPAEGLCAAAVAKGFPAEKVLPLGIPIKEQHALSLSKEEAREALAFDKELKTVLVMSGSMGRGNLAKTLRAIDGAPFPLHIVTVCGTNKRAQRKIEKQRFQNKVTVFGYTDKVPLLMTAADCMISKPGGLSTSEVLTKQLPLLIFDPIPGHEERNAAFLEQAGAALWVKERQALLPALLSVLTDSTRREAIMEAERRLQKPQAAASIAEAVLALAHSSDED